MSKAPRLVYFDRSAWADLVRDQDAGGDATDRLKRAVTSNRVKIAISDAVVDETLPLLTLSIAIGARHLALLLSLADWKKGVVKTDHRRHGGGPQKEDETHPGPRSRAAPIAGKGALRTGGPSTPPSPTHRTL
jgi:hypothetical protein